MRKPILLLLTILVGLMSSGCVTLLEEAAEVMLQEGVAERPYRKSMERGTLSPHEYRQIRDQIERDARHLR